MAWSLQYVTLAEPCHLTAWEHEYGGGQHLFWSLSSHFHPSAIKYSNTGIHSQNFFPFPPRRPLQPQLPLPVASYQLPISYSLPNIVILAFPPTPVTANQPITPPPISAIALLLPLPLSVPGARPQSLRAVNETKKRAPQFILTVADIVTGNSNILSKLPT